MNQAVHIFGKDLRRLRWSLVAWCAIVAGRVVADTQGADLALGGIGPLLAIRQISSMLSAIYVLALAIIIARVVQDEPLVGRDAFWLTRPIAPSSVMRAKFAFVVTFLIGLPLIARLFVAAWFGTSAGPIIQVIPTFLINHLVGVMVLWAIAALTPSLTRYVIAILGVIVSFVLFTTLLLLVQLFAATEAQEGGEYQLPDWTPAVVAGVLIILTALAAIVTQYRSRRTSRALMAGFIGLVLVFIVPPNWKWSFAARPTAEIASPPVDSPSLSVALDGSKPRVGESMALNRRTSPRKEIAVPAVVTGVPREFHMRTIVGRSRLELPNGVVLEDLRGRRGSGFYAIGGGYGGSSLGRESAVEAALGGVRLLNRSSRPELLSPDQWASLLVVHEEDFARYRREAGRLTADLEIMFARGFQRASMPLRDGEVTEVNNVRNKIVRVIRRATGCTVLFRRSYVESLFIRSQSPDLTLVLRNQSRGEAISSRSGMLHGEGFSADGFFLPPIRIGGRGFVVEQLDLGFPEQWGFEAPVDLDESWLSGAELVIVEMVDAGYLTRRVTLDGFRMTP